MQGPGPSAAWLSYWDSSGCPTRACSLSCSLAGLALSLSSPHPSASAHTAGDCGVSALPDTLQPAFNNHSFKTLGFSHTVSPPRAALSLQCHWLSHLTPPHPTPDQTTVHTHLLIWRPIHTGCVGSPQAQVNHLCPKESDFPNVIKCDSMPWQWVVLFLVVRSQG